MGGAWPTKLEMSSRQRVWRLMRRGSTHLLRLRERHRQRHRLAQLDDRELADIGRSREEARAEASRPFWRG